MHVDSGLWGSGPQAQPSEDMTVAGDFWPQPCQGLMKGMQTSEMNFPEEHFSKKQQPHELKMKIDGQEKLESTLVRNAKHIQ